MYHTMPPTCSATECHGATRGGAHVRDAITFQIQKPNEEYAGFCILESSRKVPCIGICSLLKWNVRPGAFCACFIRLI